MEYEVNKLNGKCSDNFHSVWTGQSSLSLPGIVDSQLVPVRVKNK